MCNLYSHTSTIEAIRALVGEFRNLAGNLAPLGGIVATPCRGEQR